MIRSGLLGVCFVFLAGSVAAAQDVTLGFQTSLSGPISSIGLSLKKGMEAGQAYLGDIGGRRIKVVVLDDASDPSTAARNARKLIEEHKVDALMGSAGSPLTQASAVIGFEENVPMIALAPIAPPADKRAWMIVVPQPPDLMIKADVDAMVKQGIKTVAYIGFSDAWGDLVYNGLVKAAGPAGIKVLTNERYARADTSVTGQVLKIIAARPDAVVTGGSGTPGATPHFALQERGYKGPIYSSHAIINDDFIKVGGSAVEGVIAPTGPIIVAEQLPVGSPTREISFKYREVFQKTHNEPANDANAGYAFDGWLILADAAKRAALRAKPGTAEFRTALRDAMITTRDLVGVHGVYNFKPGELYGVDERARAMVRLEGGKWKLLP